MYRPEDHPLIHPFLVGFLATLGVTTALSLGTGLGLLILLGLLNVL